MRLWVKIALLNSALVTFLSILIGMGIRDTIIGSMRTELTNHGVSVARHLSDRIADAILLRDFYKVKEAVSDVKQKEADLEYVFVTDDAGKMLAHTFTAGSPVDILKWNPLTGKDAGIQLLDTEKGFIRDIGVRVIEGLGAEVHIGMREDRINQTVGRIRDIIIALTGLVVVLGATVSFVMSRFITRHLSELVQFTSGLARGDFDQKIDVKSSDEIGELAGRFQSLATELKSYKERLGESYKQMLRTEKLTALGHLSAGLAHELRNPLTSIKVLFQAFREDPRLTPRDMEVVLAAVEQMDDLLTKFLRFARSDEFNPSEVYLNSVLKQVVNLVQFQLRRQSIDLQLDMSKLPAVRADRSLLQQALLNLVMNAVEAMPQGGTLTIASTFEGEHYRIGISDTGSGIPAAIRDKIYDPFFTTKEEGTGLGLSIVYNIMNIHHGHIDMQPSEKGTTFWLTIPCHPVEPSLS